MNMVLRARDTLVRTSFVEVTPQLRRLLEDLVEAALDALDQIDGDADYEPDEDGEEDGTTAEPTLGWTDAEAARGVPRVDHYRRTTRTEDGQAEPSLGWTEGEARTGRYAGMGDDLEIDGDGEPSLGWTNPDPLYCQSLGSCEDLEESCEDEGAQCDDEGDRTDFEEELVWLNPGDVRD